MRIENVDARDGLAAIKSGSLDCIWTSPPYKDADGYSDVMLECVARELYRTAKNRTVCFVNFGCLKGEDDPFRVDRLRDLFILAGWRWDGWQSVVIWWKNGHFTPLAGDNLNNLWEWMFVFYKQTMPTLNRKLVPYADKSNAKRFGNASGLRCPGNVWPIDYETTSATIKKPHKDSCPPELVRRSLRLANLRSKALVCDPFYGGGTTARAAEELGFNFIGFEKNSETFARAVGE